MTRRPIPPRPARIQLALCFEDVAKNIFNSKDGTMTRCVSPFPLLAEHPPPRSAKQQRRKDPFRARGERPGPPTPPPPLPLRAQGAARRRPRRGHRPRPATVGAQDVPERVRPVRGPRHRGCVHRHLHLPRQSTAHPRRRRASVSAGAPAAIPAAINAAPDAAPTITTFPPDYLLDPTGCVPIESVAADVARSDDAVPSRWRSASGAGQYPKLPFLGGAGAPFSLLVKGTRAMDHLPPPVDVVRRLHARPSADAFAPHPNDVSGVLAAFAELARKEIGAGSDSGSSRCEMSSYFDLQMLYGTSAEECAAIRTFEGGKIKPDAAARRGGCDSAAAAALLVVFSRNHNLVADHVSSAGDGSDEDVFQTARHVNALALRGVPEGLRPLRRRRPAPPGTCAHASRGSESTRGRERIRRARPRAPRRARHGTRAGPRARADGGRRRPGRGRRASRGVRRAVRPRGATTSPRGSARATVPCAARARGGVCTLNEFRARCGLPRWTSFEEMTGGETKLCETLAELYRDVDEVELYTGMLCEYNVSNTGAMLPHTRAHVRATLEALANDAWFSEEKLADEGARTPRGGSNWGRRPVSRVCSPRTRARNS